MLVARKTLAIEAVVSGISSDALARHPTCAGTVTFKIFVGNITDKIGCPVAEKLMRMMRGFKYAS